MFHLPAIQRNFSGGRCELIHRLGRRLMQPGVQTFAVTDPEDLITGWAQTPSVANAIAWGRERRELDRMEDVPTGAGTTIYAGLEADPPTAFRASEAHALVFNRATTISSRCCCRRRAVFSAWSLIPMANRAPTLKSP
jgi:hypothetical protein